MWRPLGSSPGGSGWDCLCGLWREQLAWLPRLLSSVSLTSTLVFLEYLVNKSLAQKFSLLDQFLGNPCNRGWNLRSPGSRSSSANQASHHEEQPFWWKHVSLCGDKLCFLAWVNPATVFSCCNKGRFRDKYEIIILKEINPEYSLEGLMLKLRLQYFGHLMRRANSLEKDPDAGKDWGQGEKGVTEDGVGWHQDSMDVSLRKLWEIMKDRGVVWHDAVHGAAKSRTWLTN